MNEVALWGNISSLNPGAQAFTFSMFFSRFLVCVETCRVSVAKMCLCTVCLDGLASGL